MFYSLKNDSVSVEIKLPFSLYERLNKLREEQNKFYLPGKYSMDDIIASLCREKIQELIDNEPDGVLWYETWKI